MTSSGIEPPAIATANGSDVDRKPRKFWSVAANVYVWPGREVRVRHGEPRLVRVEADDAGDVLADRGQVARGQCAVDRPVDRDPVAAARAGRRRDVERDVRARADLGRAEEDRLGHERLVGHEQLGRGRLTVDQHEQSLCSQCSLSSPPNAVTLSSGTHRAVVEADGEPASSSTGTSPRTRPNRASHANVEPPWSRGPSRCPSAGRAGRPPTELGLQHRGGTPATARAERRTDAGGGVGTARAWRAARAVDAEPTSSRPRSRSLQLLARGAAAAAVDAARRPCRSLVQPTPVAGAGGNDGRAGPASASAPSAPATARARRGRRRRGRRHVRRARYRQRRRQRRDRRACRQRRRQRRGAPCQRRRRDAHRGERRHVAALASATSALSSEPSETATASALASSVAYSRGAPDSSPP